MKKGFRLPRKQKKKYRYATYDGSLSVRYEYLKLLKYYWKSNRHHPKIKAKGNFNKYLTKKSYEYFEYNQAGYDMLKAVRKEVQPYKNSLWGTSYVDTDKLTPYMEGDGLQLVRVVSLSSRPFGYLVRIDSQHNVDADDFDIEIMLERIEEYYDRCDNYEGMEIDGKYVYVYGEDIDDEGNLKDDAYIREDQPFDWDGGSWNTQALTKIDHLRTLRRILEEVQKAVSEDFYSAYGLCHFIKEYSPTGTEEDIYRIIELATGIDLDNTGWRWNRFNESDFEKRLDYLKAHYAPRIDVLETTIEYYKQMI